MTAVSVQLPLKTTDTTARAMPKEPLSTGGPSGFSMKAEYATVTINARRAIMNQVINRVCFA